MIGISARRMGNHLKIDVFDDGVGLPPRWRMETSAGVGVRVTRERLHALYPEAGGKGFTVARRKGGGTLVVVRIPLSTVGGEARAAAA